MKTFTQSVFVLILLIVGNSFLIANNVQITSDVTLTGQNTTEHSINVNFDISWDNSWRDATNWDAVWIFIKFSNNNAWKHGYLSTSKTDYSVGTNNGVIPSFSIGTTTVNSNIEGMGVFMYCSDMTAGSINWKNAKIKWYYGQNGLTDEQAAHASIKVFAIEMVYVPKGYFSLGYGNYVSDDSFVTLYSSTYSSSLPVNSQYYQITSESAINLKQINSYGSSGTYLGCNSCPSSTLNLAYPKGYAAFYCMKYEISQEQYVEFINSLQPAQQENRISALTTNTYMSGNATNSSPLYRNGIRCKTAPTTTIAGIWGCDLNKNGVYGETDDGQNIACNYLSWNDALAYADWAGLRPMTELEYEKASKGPELVQYQYAWGTTNFTNVATISSEGKANETTGTVGANVVYGNNSNVQGPMRVGCFATSTSTRESAGASYYGIMELSGNLWEEVVPVICNSSLASNFDGSNGDGELYFNGNTNVSGWLTSVASGTRGGAWNSTLHYYLQSGDRSAATTAITDRYEYNGFRCVRTAQ